MINDDRQAAARAVGRCNGALFFSIFGGVWLLLSAYAFGTPNKALVLFIVVVMAATITLAWRIQRRGKDAAKDAYPSEERKRNDRGFGIVNAVTWTSVFLVFVLFPRMGIERLIFPTLVSIVGLHFFPMPKLYRHTANFVTGACMVVWAIVCPFFTSGDRMIGYEALGAGLILWLSSSWALVTANRLLRSIGL